MATPNPHAFGSSSDVFLSSLSLAQIRTLHRTMQEQIEDKAARLRAQVGGSYRELLGTADTIVRMRRDMDAVRARLGRVGSQCGRALVGTKATTLAAFLDASVPGDGAPARSEAARARLLEACGAAVVKLLLMTPKSSPGGRGGEGLGSRGGGRGRGAKLLLAAKVLLLGRLLVKSLPDADGARFKASKRLIVSLRDRLPRSIDQLLAGADEGDDTGDGDHFADALCAFGLNSSSGAADVLRHFLKVRAEVILLVIGATDEEAGADAGTDADAGTAPHTAAPDAKHAADDFIKALELYTRTLREAGELVSSTPNRLGQALRDLGSRPLLQDAELGQLEPLRLDRYAPLCGDDVECFTPFTRHDDLDSAQALDLVDEWARRGAQMLLAGLARALGLMRGPRAVLRLRTTVLQSWLRDRDRVRREGGDSGGGAAAAMLPALQGAFRDRLLALAGERADKLRLVGAEATAKVQRLLREGETEPAPPLWDTRLLRCDLDGADGIRALLGDLDSRLDGRSMAVARISCTYEAWRRIVTDVAAVAAAVAQHRWTPEVVLSPAEPARKGQGQAVELGADDALAITDRLRDRVAAAFAALDVHLSRIWDEGGEQSPQHAAVTAAYLVRVVREVRAHSQPAAGAKMGDFGLALVPGLHEALAAAATRTALDGLAVGDLVPDPALQRKGAQLLRRLWRGDPGLPVQPAPGVYRLLRQTATAMYEAGPDLWSVTAAQAVRRRLAAGAARVWRPAIAAVDHAVLSDQSGNRDGLDPVKHDQDKASSKEGRKEAERMADGDRSEEAAKAEQGTPAQVFTQWYMDAAYLGQFLDDSGGDDGNCLVGLRQQFGRRAGLDAQAIGRLDTAAAEYFKRTCLLFGLLVPVEKWKGII